VGEFFLGVLAAVAVEIVVVAWVTAIRTTRRLRRLVGGAVFDTVGVDGEMPVDMETSAATRHQMTDNEPADEAGDACR
jgi:HAMP domain-containing protein